MIVAKSQYNPEAMRNCTPGAYNNENADDKKEPGVFATAYGGGPIEYLTCWMRGAPTACSATWSSDSAQTSPYRGPKPLEPSTAETSPSVMRRAVRCRVGSAYVLRSVSEGLWPNRRR